MKISLEWLREYVAIPDDLTIDTIAHDLTMATVEVEGFEDLAAPLHGVRVAEIVSVATDPAAAEKQIVKCQLGKEQLSIQFNGSQLSKGKLVPVNESGAICSVDSLGLRDLFPDQDAGHPPDLSGLDASHGDELAAAIQWQDTIFEIDNKSLTNRPDLWGHYGLARELAAIYRLPLKPWRQAELPSPDASMIGKIAKEDCTRFTTARFSNAEPVSSPFWLRNRLARLGQRPINLYVDLTNYVMFDTGQPCHAFDAALLTLPLQVRRAKDGEKLKLLDERDYTLNSSMLVIGDAKRAVSLAGILGGDDTGVTAATREVVLEIGSFDALPIRRTATKLGLRTDASSRFEKGIDTARNEQALHRFVDLLQQIQPGAKLAGLSQVHPRPTESVTLQVPVEFLQARLGEPLAADVMQQTLERLGFTATCESDVMTVTAPVWRSTGDITLPHDLIEEIARLYGYENFRYTPPKVALVQPKNDKRSLLVRRLREISAGYCNLQEVVSYPWCSDRYLQACGIATTDCLKLSSPPAPDQQCLRPSLIPNLLESVVVNLRFATEFRIFEAGRVFLNSQNRQTHAADLPDQPYHLAGALVGSDPETLLLEAKGIVETLCRHAHCTPLEFAKVQGADWLGRDAAIGLTTGGKNVGSVGVIANRTQRLAGIKRARVVVYELIVDDLSVLESRENSYARLAEFPDSTADISLLLDDAVGWDSLSAALQDFHPLLRSVEFIDQYRGKGVPDNHKSVTLRLRLGSAERTLKSEEINEIVASCTAMLQQQFSAELRG